MSRKPLKNLVKYDLGAWRTRCNLSQAEAATLMGLSVPTFWRAERCGVINLLLAWACYGYERNLADRQAGTLPPT